MEALAPCSIPNCARRFVDPLAEIAPWTPETDRALGGDGVLGLALRPVVIESPLAGDVERNRRYLDAAILDCVKRGETPYASHRMLVGALDDLKPDEREAGIQVGFAMARALHAVGAPRVVYLDCGISNGIGRGIAHAIEIGQRVEYREIPGWER